MAIDYTNYADLYKNSLDFKDMIDHGGVAYQNPNGTWGVTLTPKAPPSGGGVYNSKVSSNNSPTSSDGWTSQNGQSYNDQYKGITWDIEPTSGNIYNIDDGSKLQAIQNAVNAIQGAGGTLPQATLDALKGFNGVTPYAVPNQVGGSYLNNNGSVLDFDAFLDSINNLIGKITKGTDEQTQNTQKPLVYTPPKQEENVSAINTRKVQGLDGQKYNLNDGWNDDNKVTNAFGRASGNTLTY